ncbi:MAG: hypothetical protein QJR06_05730 [Alicyclobacillaceae bacterium]|nr:hypothetical protein [Alicyclobacillaceae bacterium]
MNVVWFGHVPWEDFADLRRFCNIPARVLYWVDGPAPRSPLARVSHGEPIERAGADVRRISWRRALELPPDETVAFISHPLWPLLFRGWRPRRLVAVWPEPSGEDRGWWYRFATLVSGAVDAVWAVSEPMYLQESFRRVGVFFAGGGSEVPDREGPGEAEELFVRVADRLMRGMSVEDLEAVQWRSRVRDYEKLLQSSGPHETVLFLTAAYRYLLHDPKAEEDLLRSFELAVVAGRPDCLRTHYRFLSAVRAQAGDIEGAVQVYGVTALEEGERREYDRLRDWVGRGERELAAARIYCLNDDFRSASRVLRGLSGDAARRLRAEAAVRAGRWADALQEWVPADGRIRARRRDAAVVRGTIDLLRGNRAGAVHHFLRAAAEDIQALGRLLELRAVDKHLERLAGKGESFDESGSKEPGQSVDGDDAGAQ